MYDVGLMNVKTFRKRKRKFEDERAFIKVPVPCNFWEAAGKWQD